VLLGVAAGLLGTGLTLPILEVEAFLLFRDPVSILDGVALLWDDGEWLIAAIVLAFSAIFPAAKILAGLALWLRLRRRRRVAPGWATALTAIGRWSMLDVFVVALAVFSIKASALGEARVESAIVPFLGAIAATAAATRMLEAAARRAATAG
jgi:paraquat-inducible protein A